MAKIERERVERVARIYSSNQEASQALGIVMQSFGRLCREYGIESPYARRRRLRQRPSVRSESTRSSRRRES